jgi:hypothetical protein
VPQGYRQLQFLESQQIDTDEANIIAGMDVALDIVRATEMVSGRSNVMTPADVLTLAEAAKAERSPAAAADIAARLSVLLLPGAVREDGTPYSQASVLQQYSDLADMCLKQRLVQLTGATGCLQGQGFQIVVYPLCAHPFSSGCCLHCERQQQSQWTAVQQGI